MCNKNHVSKHKKVELKNQKEPYSTTWMDSVTIDQICYNSEMSYKLQHLLVSDYFITATGGKNSIIGIFDEIKLPKEKKLPFFVPSLFVSGGVVVSQEEVAKNVEKTLQIKIQDPDGNELYSLDLNMKFGEARNFSAQFINMEIKKTGTYIIKVMNDEEEIGKVSIAVKQVE
jgi:hypothetical protein